MGTSKSLGAHEKEMERLRMELDFWKGKAKEDKEKKSRFFYERQRWENAYSLISAKLERCLQENEQLKAIIENEKGKTSMMRKENKSLHVIIQTLEQQLQTQKFDIVSIIQEYREREAEWGQANDLAMDASMRWKIETLGRQQYIDHLTGKSTKLWLKASEMVEKGKALKQNVNPVGEYGQCLVNFLEKAQEQYEQIRCFYGCNP